MRVYVISLAGIPSLEGDEKFTKFIESSNYEWWRHMPLTWVILTPDSVTTNFLMVKVAETYGAIFHLILEVNINDIGGMYTASKEVAEKLPKGFNPFQWFHDIKRKDFVPKWERENKPSE